MADNRRVVILAALLIVLGAVAPSAAQFPPPGDPAAAFLAETGPVKDPINVSAVFTDPAQGQPAMLYITATLKQGWHTYAITQEGGPGPSQIRVKPSAAFRLGKFQASPPPDKKVEPLFDNATVETHHGTVTWYAQLELAPGVDPAQVKIEGSVWAQVCEGMTQCLPPRDYPFTAVLTANPPSITVIAPGKGAAIKTEATKTVNWNELAWKLVLAFLGGLILNLMPCVLPVISLKVLSFVAQAGESRARIFTLNLWYSLGLISVFMVLAGLAAGAGLAWGEQFTLPWFKVTMTGLVFVMALSFLGVWEIPIPGFVGTGAAGELQTKEGAGGAFFKGVFATILATPCSGPFLGPVFGYLLTQPAFVAYWIFGAVGLGMASPYLLIGAFPRLIQFLPKPGAWMETFEQVMAFLLLGTVVYLFTTLNAAYFVPTLTLLVGLWFGAWLIGRTPLTVGPMGRAVAWAASIGSAGAIGLFAFTLLLHQPKIAWKPFSPEALAQARAEGKTVMIDFTAQWCLTCKTNLKFAVDTDRVKALVEKNRVVPLLADWTDESPTIKKALNDLGSNSIPVLAIWPAGASQEKPIILTDLLSESQVLDALTRAGPSQGQPVTKVN